LRNSVAAGSVCSGFFSPLSELDVSGA